MPVFNLIWLGAHERIGQDMAVESSDANNESECFLSTSRGHGLRIRFISFVDQASCSTHRMLSVCSQLNHIVLWNGTLLVCPSA